MSIFDEIVTIDFETKAIDSALPPKPVGVAIKYGAKPAEYLAWGHSTGNNCTFAEAQQRVYHAQAQKDVLYHNGMFDMGVAKQHMHIAYPYRNHDTLLLLFLSNPHASTLRLKPSCDALLGIAPTEQDEVKNWILQHIPKATTKNYGGFISEAPGDLVGRYAIGDVDRAYELFKLLYSKHSGPAYDRECRLTPILLNSTLEGVYVDTSKLSEDYDKYTQVRKNVEKHIFDKLGYSFNLDSGAELAEAIDKAGLNAQWVYTKTGKRSVSKENLMAAIKDEELLALLNYRGTLTTYLDTFMSSWLEKVQNSKIHFAWNQVRNEEAGGIKGTRTGRLSSVPSMLNVPKAAKATPECIARFNLPPLPLVRQYLLPDPGHKWLSRDYSSQELRVLAHYDDDQLMNAYINNPKLDLHQMMSEEISKVLGRPFARRPAKTVAFSILYGSGLSKLAEELDCPVSEAGIIKATYLRLLPGVANVQASIKDAWNKGGPIKTWGDRYYYKEPSKIIVDKKTGQPRMADFTYKGLNYLIQGSSADITKQAIINYNEIRQDGRFLLAVHDQIDISGPSSEMRLLQQAMNDIKVDVPMLSDGTYGPNFGERHEFD